MLGIIFFIVQITGKADSLCQSVDAFSLNVILVLFVMVIIPFLKSNNVFQ